MPSPDSDNNNNQQNPPSRPKLRSNFELEPNPFEQSFSSGSLSNVRNVLIASRNANGGSHDSQDTDSTNNNKSPTNPTRKSPSAASSTTQGSHSRKQSLSNPHPNGDTPKPTLPPLASITSPSDPSYAWSFSSAALTNSLRAGPLSPAMLAGPQTQQPASTSQPASSIAALAASASSMHPPIFGFDPSGSFRTGLTPSTGLTPLVGGPVAFPPPSPNTAAFLAMVNSGAAGSAAAATITPNTLNALTGALQQHTAASQVQQQSNGNTVGGNSSSGQSQTQTSVAPSQMAVSASTTYQSSPLASQSRYAQQSNMYQTTQAQLYDSNSNGNGYTGPSGAANHAANGLFLLSQAHQELTKREEAQKQQNMAQSNGSAVNGKGSAAQNQAAQAQTTATTIGIAVNNSKRGAKRKGDSGSVTSTTSTKASAPKKAKSSAAVTTRGAATRRGSIATSLSNAEGDDDMGMEGMDEFEESDDEGANASANGNNKNKKPETEEEKRKNFLERNRQAALKCRQRKKQWLAQLQAKNEYLINENERLTAALVSSREEISRLSQLVGGAGVGLPVGASGVVPMVGMSVQQQPVHHAPFMNHQQQHHPIAVPVSLPQNSSSIAATAGSPPMATKASPRTQQHHQQQQHSPNPHSPASDGRSSRSSFREQQRDYSNGAGGRETNGRDYARDMREREMGHVHGHAPQAVAVNGRGYGY